MQKTGKGTADVSMRNGGATAGRGQGLTADEHRLFRELIEQHTGVFLPNDQRLTFHMKVCHRLSLLGFDSYQKYYGAVASDPEGGELGVLLSHLMDRDSRFFSDRKQFDLFSMFLKQTVEANKDAKPRSLRVLSAATATGEEAYTISAVIENIGLAAAGWDVSVTGMDFDEGAVERAVVGRYGRESFGDMQGREQFISTFFDTDGQHFTARERLRRHISFRIGSIVDRWSFAGLGTQDVVFCRNILSHMSGNGIKRAVGNIHSVLSDSGCLIIGSSESLIRMTNLFLPQYIDGMVLYRKNPVAGLEIDAIAGRDNLQERAG